MAFLCITAQMHTFCCLIRYIYIDTINRYQIKAELSISKKKQQTAFAAPHSHSERSGKTGYFLCLVGRWYK